MIKCKQKLHNFKKYQILYIMIFIKIHYFTKITILLINNKFLGMTIKIIITINLIFLDRELISKISKTNNINKTSKIIKMDKFLKIF
jgi:hypothetical protein